MVIELGTMETTFPGFGWLISTGARGTYRAEVSCDLLDDEGKLLDLLISFVFDTLRGDSLDLRVTPCDVLKKEAL